jgi:copper chaperone CopZ
LLSVTGMHCSSCSSLIEEILIEHPGVVTASVDLDGGRAQVTYDQSALTTDEVCAAVSGVGYGATVVEGPLAT